MESKKIRMQVIILFLLILANFIAQVPYYLHLYYNPDNLFAEARGILIMLFVFAVFLFASGYFIALLLVKRSSFLATQESEKSLTKYSL